jgi:cytochrome c oxidase cbb3-type subunit II
MPAFVWLAKDTVDPVEVGAKMRALRRIGVPYSDNDIGSAAELVTGHSELDALVSYLQVLKYNGEVAQ